jgi:tetratricopeptide (TPR) repeat protein
VQRAFTHGWSEPRGRAALDLALELARRAVEIEPDSGLCLGRLAFVLLLHGRYDEALETGRAAVRANASSFESRFTYGEILTHAGDPAEAVREIRLAIALDPFCPPSFQAALGRALLLAGQPEAALPELRWCAARMPDYGPCHHTMVVAAAETGRMEEARAALREALRLRPDLRPRNHEGLWFFRREENVERFRAAFRAAGLREV